MKKIILVAFLAVPIVTTVAIARTTDETQPKKQVNSIGWNTAGHSHRSILLADISDSQQIPCQWCKKRNPPTPTGTSATTADSACTASALTAITDPTRKHPTAADNAASAVEDK